MSKITRADRRGLEVRHLAALDAVARHGSFNRAAEELGYTQSAVSQQIVTLERVVGARMFERSAGPRPIRLTEAGRLLWAHARAVLARMEAATADIGALTDGSAGELRVGTYQSVATRVLPPLVARFRSAWPRIEVTLFESGSHDEIDDMVERGTLDLAFTHPPVSREDVFEYVDLLRDPYVLVVAPGHELSRGGGRVELADLGRIDLVGYRLCRANLQVERFLRSRGVEPHVVLRAEDNTLLQSLAAQGVGAAIMPLLAIDPARDDTVVLDLRGLVPHRRIGLVWHRDRYRSPAAEAFVSLARRLSAELAEEVGSDSVSRAPAKPVESREAAPARLPR
jgi:DNA-binding transcriptional LysR family regulator